MSAVIKERTYSLDEMAGAFLAIRNKMLEIQKKADKEIKTLQNILDIPNNKVWLMPEGVTDDELTKRRRWLMEYATEHGYNFTDRLHIIVYGDKRGV